MLLRKLNMGVIELAYKTKNINKLIVDIIFFFIGSFIFAVSINVFLSPNNIVPSGLTGVSTMINYLFGLPIGIMTIILNIPLFIWGIIETGYASIAKTMVATVMSSAAVDITKPFLPQYKGDLLLACLFGGALCGIGLGLVFARGGTTGGTDLIASLTSHYIRSMSIGNLILMINLVIVLTSALIYKNLESPMYAVIFIFVSTKIIDNVLYGINRGMGKTMFIISDKHEEIAKKIMSDIGRGVTAIKSRGVYSNKEGEMLMCAVDRHQVYKTYDIIHSIDPNAFIIVGAMGEIVGRGFENKD